MSRLIMHIDMDAFFASIEQQINPALRGRPLIVGGRPGRERTVVCAASYEARRFGVKSGMSSREALRLCSQALFLPADSAKYLYTSDRIGEILQEYTPQVEDYSIDEFFLDISSSQPSFGKAEGIARRIKKRIWEEFGITCSIGIAPNKLLAKLASELEKPDGLTIVKLEGVPGLLEDLPVEKLAGIGEKLKKRLERLGIATCGHLGRYPVKELERRFGVVGRMLSAMGRGEDESPVGYCDEVSSPKSMGHSQTFARDTRNPAFIRCQLLFLSERVARRLRKAGLKGRTVSLVLRDSNFCTFSRQITLPEPTSDGYQVYLRALFLLERLDLGWREVRLVGVSASSLSPSKQLSLFLREQRGQRLLQTIDRINDKHAEFTLLPAACLLYEKQR
ncbi:DNA polymerase IV, partial [bacterium]|nr:DNA polymerase IV [bacterium]